MTKYEQSFYRLHPYNNTANASGSIAVPQDSVRPQTDSTQNNAFVSHCSVETADGRSARRPASLCVIVNVLFTFCL